MSATLRTTLKTPALLAIACVLACLVGLAGFDSAYAATADSLQAGGSQIGAAVKVYPEYGDDAANTTGEANVRTVYRFGWINGGTNTMTKQTNSSYDVTGDGWADKIQVIGARKTKTSGYLSQVKVLVNGKTAYSYKNTNEYINRAVVSVVTLKNKQPFLWVDLLDGKGHGIQKLFQYEGKKFHKVLSNKDVAKRRTSNQVITSLAPDGNVIRVSFSLATTATGITTLKYNYAMYDGWLERTSDYAASLSYATNDRGTCSTNKLTAAGTFKVYKKPNLKKVAFTVKSGKVVVVDDARIMGNKLLYRVKLGGKAGWIACPIIKRASSKAPKTLFYETYGKRNLKSTYPTYSSTKLFTARQLQQYNDHALYIARNEICARNGYRFSNAELRNRFEGQSWYPSHRLALNSVEQANLDLILSIEKNRNSLYAG